MRATEQLSIPGAGLSSYFPPYLLYKLRYEPLRFLQGIEKSHDIAYLGWVGNPLYYVSSPELVRELLMDTKSFVKGTMLKKLEIIIGQGLITLNGEEWREARRRVQKVFTKGLLPVQQQAVAAYTDCMIQRLLDAPPGQPVNLDRVMNELTFNIALDLFLGATSESVESMDELQWAIDELNAYAKWRTWSSIPPHWKTKRNERFHKALGILDAVVEKVLRVRQAETSAERLQRTDVLSQLLAAGFEGKPLRDNIMTMLIAGHETTGTTLSFLWANVARRRDVQERLYQESACAKGTDVTDLPFAEAVWKETLRLYPAVPVLDRTASSDVSLAGYRIPQGANVLWSPYVVQRSPRYWPSRVDTETFDPFAFVATPTPDPGSFIPFGEGPRMCLGKAFADMEALAIISRFAKAFRMEPATPGPVEMTTLVTLRPKNGVMVKLTPRERVEEQLPADQSNLPAGAVTRALAELATTQGA